MKISNQASLSLFKEGLNTLKVYPSFLLNQTWSRPVSINFILTTRCNSKCITCDSWKLEDHAGELTTEDFKRLATQTRELNIPIVTLGGGEPTLRTDVWEIVKFFKNENRFVQLTTNALTLRESQRQKLFESKLDRVTVSVDSHKKDLYEKIRGIDGWNAVETNLKNLLKEKTPHTEVDTNTVLCKDNAETFLETLDYLIDLGIPKVNFSAMTTNATNYLMTESKAHLSEIPNNLLQKIVEGILERKKKTKAISASSTFIKGILDYYQNPHKTVFPCYAGFLTLDIFQDGAVHGCGNLPTLANVKNESLSQIWHSTKAQENRNNMAKGKCPNCYVSCKMELAIASNPKFLPQFSLEKISLGN